MSHAERTERRRKIAEAVTGPESIPSVATEFGVTIETVRASCRQFAPEKLQSRQKTSAA